MRDLETLATGLNGFGHPVRLRCLVLLEVERSPSEIWQLLGGLHSLGTVSYHIRMMRQYELVEETRAEPVRGALEHFYQRTELAEEILKVIAPLLGLPKRGPGRPGRNGARTQALLALLGAPVEEEEKVAA